MRLCGCAGSSEPWLFADESTDLKLPNRGSVEKLLSVMFFSALNDMLKKQGYIIYWLHPFYSNY